MREELSKKCEELRLSQEETNLLYDLLGWNIGADEQVPPVSHRGLKVYKGLPWFEPEMAERITALCEKILGPYLQEVRDNPDGFFYAQYTHKTGSRGVGTILRQLGISSSDIDYDFINYLAPELLYRSFIRILASLLTLSGKYGLEQPTD